MRKPDNPEPFDEPAHGARQQGRKNGTDAYHSPSSETDHSFSTAGTAGKPELIGILTESHAQWLEDRNIDPEIATRYGVESAKGLGTGSWIGWRYPNNGIQFRRTDAKEYRWLKGSKLDWWNKDSLFDATLVDTPLVITEGVLDALSALSAGYRRVVSVPIGAPSSEDTTGNRKYSFIADSLDDLKGFKEIILAVDGDEPGLNLQHDLSIRLNRGRCKYVEYPDGTKDLNDVARLFGFNAVVNTLQTARWCHVPGLFRMSELPPIPYAKPFATRIDGLDEHYRLRKGDFTVVTGVPGSGKSTFVNDVCCRMAAWHEWNTCFASFEQMPQVDHRRALRTWHSRRYERDMDAVQTVSADAWIDQCFSFVVPSEDDDCSLEWCLERMASSVVRYGSDICVIDPWNEMDHNKPSDMTTTEYVGAAIRQLKRFARKWNVHLIVVAHPSKMAREKQSGLIPMPTMYDISDSAHWWNKPDVGIIVHPQQDDFVGPHTAVKVAKSRYHDQIGKPGTVKLKYEPQTSRFEKVS